MLPDIIKIFLLIVFVSTSALALIDTNTRSGKECPLNPPILFGDENSQIECNLNIHPTGNEGDPSCYYSNCDTGGDQTVMCGCVDYSLFSQIGAYWECLYSQCGGPPIGSKQLDRCGIHGLNFMNRTFLGVDSIAGRGHDMVDGELCLCQPFLGDEEPMSWWKWQCRKNSSTSSGYVPTVGIFTIYVAVISLFL